MITVQQIKEKYFKGDYNVLYIKFVKVANKYRFALIEQDHRTMVFDGEIPQSAGIIKLYPNKKTWEYEGWSASLKLSLDEEDYSQLGIIFDLKKD